MLLWRYGCIAFAVQLVLWAVSPLYAFEYDLHGHFRGNGFLSLYQSDDLMIDGSEYFLDGIVDFRLQSTLYLYKGIHFDVAYSAVAAAGQERRAFSTVYGDADSAVFFSLSTQGDDSQLLSLTRILLEDNDHLVYHAVDRLFLTFDTNYGTFKAGRQPLTWGNGMVFNPADVVSPFSPSDIVRDYKSGSDMVLYQYGDETVSDFQLVYVPRRNEKGDIDWDESTVGVRTKVSWHENDFDFYGIKHYRDYVMGFGLTGYLRDAVLRTDMTMTFLQSDGESRQYFSAVANMDYSWVWCEHNWYSLVELYYNGIGVDRVEEAVFDRALSERLSRGELFTTGRLYLDAMVQYELHPLVNAYLSYIYNLVDGSYFLQPRMVWDNSESTRFLFGFDFPIGGRGEEFGYIRSESGEKSGRGIKMYCMYTWFF